MSPRDVMLDDSAPPSTALTNLTTPGTTYFDSPNMVHSADTSPMFHDEDLDHDVEAWPSLFPGEGATTYTEADYVATPDLKREQTSPTSSSHGRHSSVAGVKARKRDKPLEDLSVKMAAASSATDRKRIKNTEAARKSRAKKTERTEQMQQRIFDLEAEVRHWKSQALRVNPNSVTPF